MYYRQKKDTYIRNYDGLGYITSTGLCNDKVVNESGTVFLCALSRTPQTLDQLADKILKSFVDVDKEIILKYAERFYESFVQDGFIVKGETIQELDAADKGFSYHQKTPVTIREDFSPVIHRADSDTQEFLEVFFKGHPHLTSFQIELTSRCNERCVHCYIPHDMKHSEITEEMFYSVMEQLSELGVLSVSLSGGECMLHPKFKDFLRTTKKYDFYINILSNLTRLDDEMIQIMKEINLSMVQVSVYSMIPEHHDTITQVPGSLEKTLNAITKLIENDIPVTVSCPTMKINKDDYKDVLKWCQERKIRAQTDYIIMAQYTGDTSNLSQRLSVEEAAEVIKDITLFDERYQRTIMKPEFMENCNKAQFNPERRLCGVGISRCSMVANGNVYPCAGWQGMVLGNLNTDTLKNIWDNSEKIKWLRSLKMKDMGHGECCKCENAAFCAPCMVRNANESSTADPLEVNRHFCKVAEMNRKIVFEWREKNLKAGAE